MASLVTWLGIILLVLQVIEALQKIKANRKWDSALGLTLQGLSFVSFPTV
jgi:hypothetical protein